MLTQAKRPIAFSLISAPVFVHRLAGASQPRRDFVFAAVVALVALFSSDLAFGQTSQAYSFLAEYVRELGEIEDVRVSAIRKKERIRTR